MKQNLMRLLPAAAIAAALALGACSGKKGGNEATADSIGSAFTTDSVHWADSLVLGGCKANVTIDGQYPTTEGRLSDSVRAWLGARLSYGMTGSARLGSERLPLVRGRQHHHLLRVYLQLHADLPHRQPAHLSV